MEDFKQFLNENPEEEERAAAEQIRSGLKGLQLEHKVAQVAAERRTLLRRRFWVRVFAIAIFAGMAGAVGWFFRKKELPAEQVAPQQEVAPSTPIQPQTLPQGSPTLQSPPPIVERIRPRREREEQPLLRSVQPGLDSMTNQLIDVLLAITIDNYRPKTGTPPEISRAWSDAVRRLRENRPAQAKAIIFTLDNTGMGWDTGWLLGIALLEEGKPEEARAVFERLAKDPSNPHRQDAQLATEALR